MAQIMLLAALFHDIGKSKTTKIDLDGSIHSPHHSKVGANVTRTILFKVQVPFGIREDIVNLIRNHQWIFHAKFDDRDFYKLLVTSCYTRLDLLCILAEMDGKGRSYVGLNRTLEEIELFKGFAIENNCYSNQFAFPDDHTRFMYINGGSNIDPHYKVFDDFKNDVTIVCGLPGSGKDYWIKNNNKDNLPIISLDDIRKELKVKPTDNQGHVIARAHESAKEYLRKNQHFIWNSTNVTKILRSSIINLCKDYKAKTHLVYIEAKYNRLLEQNKNRANPVPENVLDKLINKLEVPNITETHTMEYVLNY